MLAGGVFAGVLGPQIVIFTKDLLPPTLRRQLSRPVGLRDGGGRVVLHIREDPAAAATRQPPARVRSREIVRTPRFIVAVTCGMASYSMMNLVMTAAPLAMVGCGHSVTDATLGIQWHVLGMFGPSFITGSLIARFGITRITGIGLAMIALTARGRHFRAFGGAFLDRAGAARRRLEFRLHRRHHAGDADAPAGGAHQGAVVQRLPDLRLRWR